MQGNLWVWKENRRVYEQVCVSLCFLKSNFCMMLENVTLELQEVEKSVWKKNCLCLWGRFPSCEGTSRSRGELCRWMKLLFLSSEFKISTVVYFFNYPSRSWLPEWRLYKESKPGHVKCSKKPRSIRGCIFERWDSAIAIACSKGQQCAKC